MKHIFVEKYTNTYVCMLYNTIDIDKKIKYVVYSIFVPTSARPTPCT